MRALSSSLRVLALSILGLPVAANAQEDPFLSGEVAVGERTYPFRLLTPAKITEGERYPLVLFLHGAGERGSDNEAQLMHFPERMVEAGYRERYPCFVLAPQCPEGDQWVRVAWAAPQSTPMAPEPIDPMLAAIASLEQVVREHPIDLDRIYLTGLSMGGYGTWDLAMRHPDWFAAAAPVCGGGDEQEASRLAGLPLSVWHGAADTVIPPRRSQVMVEALSELGDEARYTELEGVGHDAWVAAYGDEGCLDWLFAKRREPNAQLAAAAALLAKAVAKDERIAFLGDSITQAGNQPGGYVDLLREALQVEREDVQVIPAGISGHRVPDLLARFERDVIEQDATLVFVYIGINDVWHSKSESGGTSPEEYESGLRTLIQTLRASGADVVLATPSVIGERPQGENELDGMLADYAALSRAVAEAEGATLCDLQRAFQGHLAVLNPSGLDTGVLTRDGVHLNPAGNAFVATWAARALRAAVLAR